MHEIGLAELADTLKNYPADLTTEDLLEASRLLKKINFWMDVRMNQRGVEID